MKNYQLELRQIVDFPRCRIYREFVQDLLTDRSIRTGGCSGLFYFVVLCSYANFRTSYKRYNADVFTGVNCRTAAVFQFHSAALRRLNKVGCQRYEGDYTRLKQKHAERRARRMAG